MTSLEKIKIHKPTPTTILYNASNQVGAEIVRAMLEHEGFIIVVDEITENETNLYSEFLNNEYFLLLDKRALNSLDRNLSRLDYFIYFGFGIETPEKVLDPNVFLEKNSELSVALTLSQRFATKFTYVSSLIALQRIMNFRFSSEMSDSLAYSCAELQRYSENFVIEKNKKVGVDTRIIRLGETIGEGLNLSLDNTIANLIKSAISKNKLRIYGDGLDINYLVNIVDAAQGIIKSLFSKKSTGNIYNLAYEEEYTTLQIAYKIKELDPGAGDVEFIENKNYDALARIFKFEQNQMEIGWIARHSVEQSLAESLDYATSVQNSDKIIHGVNEFDPDSVESAKRKLSYSVEDLEHSPVNKAEYKDNWDRFRTDRVIVNKTNNTSDKDEIVQDIPVESKKMDFENKFSDSLIESLSTNHQVVPNNLPFKFDELVDKSPNIDFQKFNLADKKDKKVSFLQIGIIFSIILFVGALIYIVAISPFMQRSVELSNIEKILTDNTNSEYLTFTSINKLNESIAKLKSADDSIFLSNTVARDESKYLPLTLKTINLASSINSIRDKLSVAVKTGYLVRYNSAIESFEIYSADKKLITQVYVAKLEIEAIEKQITDLEASALSIATENSYAKFYDFFQKKYFVYWRGISKSDI